MGTNYNFRVRHNLAFVITLMRKEITAKTVLQVMKEVFLNFSDRIRLNTFDQNRLFAGLGYQFTDHLNAELGYMNITNRNRRETVTFQHTQSYCFYFIPLTLDLAVNS